MSRPQNIRLPVGEHPNWELDMDDGSNLRSAAESLIVLQSLRQSRDRWLNSTFPKFASKVRGGKQAEVTPPPHTMQTRGKCDMVIGPHIFPETTIYEVHYLAGQSTPLQSTTWQSGYGQQTTAGSSTTSTSASQSSPLISTLASSASISPELIGKVNLAASTSPTLANLLQLAAAGGASPDQLKTLGLLIQSLANTDTSAALTQGAVSQSSQTLQHPVRPFDIVFEFRESRTERWILPREPVICAKVQETEAGFVPLDIVITTAIPFFQALGTQPTTETGNGSVTSQPEAPHIAKIRLERAPHAIWDSISRWMGSEEAKRKNRETLDGIQSKAAKRIYLRHRIPEGVLLTQLRNAMSNTTLKSIRPGAPSNPKPRKRGSRKPAAVEGAVSSPAPTSATTVPKRKKPPQKKTTPAVEIACVSCAQTDVPLIMGGRFCRSCVEAGKGSMEVPRANGTGSYSYGPVQPINSPKAHTPGQVTPAASQAATHLSDETSKKENNASNIK